MMVWIDADLVKVGDIVHGIATEDESEFIFPSVDAKVIHKCAKKIKVQYPFGDTEIVPTTARFYVNMEETI